MKLLFEKIHVKEHELYSLQRVQSRTVGRVRGRLQALPGKRSFFPYFYSYNAGGNSFLEGQPVFFTTNSFPKTPAAQLASLTKEYASIERNPRRSKSSILSQADLQNIKSGNYDPAAYQRVYRPPARKPNPTSVAPSTSQTRTNAPKTQVPPTTIQTEIKKSEHPKITRRSAKATCRVEIPNGNTCSSAAITLENFVNKLMTSQKRDENSKINEIERAVARGRYETDNVKKSLERKVMTLAQDVDEKVRSNLLNIEQVKRDLNSLKLEQMANEGPFPVATVTKSVSEMDRSSEVVRIAIENFDSRVLKLERLERENRQRLQKIGDNEDRITYLNTQIEHLYNRLAQIL